MSQLAGPRAAGAHLAVPTSDPSIASSALQKAIRRGNIEVALRAAFILMRSNVDRLWRRLVVIAMEDVGIGDLALVIEVLSISGRRAWRAQNGGEELHVSGLVTRLCEAPKSRDACDLLVIADLAPGLTKNRGDLFDYDNDELLKLIVPDGPLEDCMLAAWYLGGTDRFPAYSLPPRAGDFGLLSAHLAELGASSTSLEAARLGSTRTREGFPLSLPLVALYAGNSRVSVKPEHPSSLGSIEGWPGESFDMHTSAGQAAIRRYLVSDRDMRDLLGAYMAPHKQPDFIGHLIFRLEGAAVDRRVTYSGQSEIEEGAKTAHLTYSRVSADVVAPAQRQLMRNLQALHDARVEVVRGVR